MVNQQLVDYIKDQLKAGVGEEMVKSALKAAGWADADVEEGMKTAKTPPAGVIPAGPSAPVVPAMPAAAAAAGKPAGTINSAAKSEPIAQKTSVLDVRAAIGGKDEILNNVSALGQKSAANAAGAAAKPAEAAAAIVVAAGSAAKVGFLGKISVAEIVMGVVILGLLGGGVWFYLNQAGASAKLEQLSSQNAALNGQIAGMTKTNSDLSAEAESLRASVKNLTDENAGLKDALLFFVVLPGSPVAADGITATIQGTLSAAKSGQYILTTANGVAVNVKNYKDAKVDALLKPLLGSSVTLNGTHTAGSRDFTVAAVNGQAVSAAAAEVPVPSAP